MKLLSLFLCILLFSCSKSDLLPNSDTDPDGFTVFQIEKGGHYSNRNGMQPVELSEMKFQVKFDSSAIYTTSNPSNQYDINKLYGFSEELDHHRNSSRIGWSFNEGELRLYAYAYANGQRLSREITPVALDRVHECAIRIIPGQTIFTVNGITVCLERSNTTEVAKGYKLFPYFGGDESAPSNIRIFIKEYPRN